MYTAGVLEFWIRQLQILYQPCHEKMVFSLFAFCIVKEMSSLKYLVYKLFTFGPIHFVHHDLQIKISKFCFRVLKTIFYPWFHNVLTFWREATCVPEFFDVFWIHYSIVKPQCSNLRIITAIFSVVQTLRNSMVSLFHLTSYFLSWSV